MRTQALMRFILRIILFSLVIFPPGSTLADSPQDPAGTQHGIEAADQWLTQVDKKKYPDVWLTAADVFRAAVSIGQWSDIAAAVRGPLGDLVSRHLFHDQVTTDLPGMPDGRYLILRYATAFTNKAKAVESVTVMKDEDGTWRVAGYFIK